MSISYTKLPLLLFIYLPFSIYHHIILIGFDLVANCGDSRCVLSRNGQEVDLRFEKEIERKEKRVKNG